MFKLALNAGHSYTTAGKRCLKSIDPNETREYVLNKRICDKIQNLLSNYDGISLLRIDDGTEIPISTRAKKANSFGADLYLAIHHNAGIGGESGGGVMSFTYLKVDDKTREWQKSFYDEIIALTGLSGNRSQPLSAADLGECRETKMPAVLLECGFMDSTSDTPIILTDDFAQKVANACVKCIADKALLTGKNPSVTETAVNVNDNVKSEDEIVKEVIQGKWGNGADRKAKLTAAGYDYSLIQLKVNAAVNDSKPVKKSNTEIADEVIAGKWGNGSERKSKLALAGYDYLEVQSIVNEKLKKG